MSQNINILGFGLMGRQIAALLQYAGYQVQVWSRSLDEAKDALYGKEVRKVEKYINCPVVPGGGAVYVESLASLKPALTFEVLVEDINVKQSILGQLTYDVQEYGLLTNSSSYAPIEIHPAAVGLHFFNPAYLLRFAELSCQLSELSSSCIPLITRLKEGAGFQIISVHPNRGYIGNYLLFQEISNAFKLIDYYNYNTSTIDQVLKHMGRTVSLFDIIDMVGVDVTRNIILNLKEIDSSVYFSEIFNVAIEKNVLGRKNRTSIRNLIDRQGVVK